MAPNSQARLDKMKSQSAAIYARKKQEILLVRIEKRLRAGSVPQLETLAEYGITPERANELAGKIVFDIRPDGSITRNATRKVVKKVTKASIGTKTSEPNKKAAVAHTEQAHKEDVKKFNTGDSENVPQSICSVYEEFIHQIDKDTNKNGMFQMYVENWHDEDSFSYEEREMDRSKIVNHWAYLTRKEWPVIALQKSLHNNLDLWFFYGYKEEEKYSRLKKFIFDMSNFPFGELGQFREFLQDILNSEESLDQLDNALLKYIDGYILEPVNIFEKIVLQFAFKQVLERNCDIPQVHVTINIMLSAFKCEISHICDEIPMYKHSADPPKRALRNILHVLRDSYPCESCGKDATKFCSRCSTVRYCSKECMKVDRSRHEEFCSK